jgi:phosphate transport system substrate-binding protein
MTNPFRMIMAVTAGVAVAAMIGTGAMAGEITGAGASFPYPIYAKWAEAYKKASGIGLNYQSIGSGGGIAQIKAKTVTFGASDMPLKPEELNALGLTMFPTVVGGVVPVIRIPGVAPGAMVLDGPTLADIYLGKIVKWNDPAIKKLNPNLKLPNLSIVVVHRSDGSGTSFIFTNYLSKVSKDWASRVGSATAVEWPTGTGAKGNEGVAGNVKQMMGSIGYVEYAYAEQNHLSYTRMKNREGNVVAPNMESFKAAAANADWMHADHFYMILTDQPGAKSWPIENPTFVLFYKNPNDPATSKRALDFFRWSFANGDKMAESLHYIPLPENVVKLIELSWKGIKGSGM